MNGAVYVGNGRYLACQPGHERAATQPTTSRTTLITPGWKKNNVAIPTSVELKP